MNRYIKFVVFWGGAVFMATSLSAEGFTVAIQGKERVTVTKDAVLLSDIADISSPRIHDDEAILALGRLQVAVAPKPGDSLSLSANQILETLKQAGVSLKDIGYTFPRVLSIKRAGRLIQANEVQQILQEYVSKTDADASIRSVNFKEGITIAPDAEISSITPLASSDLQRPQFLVHFTSPQQPAVQLSVTAVVDRWIEVAVMRRPIDRGQIVDQGDVVMARYSVQSVPADAVSEPAKILGLETKRRLAVGEVLQRNSFVVPTVVKAGEKVTVRYRSSLLEATATGVALDAAGLEQPIRIRNESSAKVVSGIVRAPGLVEVR